MSPGDPGDRRRARDRGRLRRRRIAGYRAARLYLAGGQTQLEAILLGVCLGGLGIGITAWSHRLLPRHQVEARHPLASPAAERPRRRPRRDGVITRRTLLLRSGRRLAGLGAALAIPVLSLGPGPGPEPVRDALEGGHPLVDLDGPPGRLDDLPVDGVLTVFPEGAPARPTARRCSSTSARTCSSCRPDRDGLGARRASSRTRRSAPTPAARSVSTGPPSTSLICPCHQSTFDVLNGAVPTFGPAARPLPQLPIQLAADGTFVARATSRSRSGRASGT